MDVEDVVERLQADPRHGNLEGGFFNQKKWGGEWYDDLESPPEKRRAPFFPIKNQGFHLGFLRDV